LPQSDAIISGTYRPSAYATAAPPFPLPAPPPPPSPADYPTNLAVFNGVNPNGNWSLFVFDDTSFDSGFVSNGWILNLSASASLSGAADVGLTMSASPPPVIVSNNLIYTISATNYGPAGASNIVVRDPLPSGSIYVSAGASLGSVTTNSAGVVAWTIPGLAANSGAALYLTTNTVTVSAATTDPNPDDDNASVISAVLAPSADLALSMVGTPNPLFLGNYLTYSLIITNLGPATAPGLALSDTLPPNVALISASPPGYSFANRVLSYTNLGNLANGGQTVVTIVALPQQPPGLATNAFTITNKAVVGSSVLDPLKANNSASVKTVVEALFLTFSHSGTSLTISWIADANNYNLESTPSMSLPTWTSVTNTPVIVSGQKYVTVPIGSQNQYFRLRASGP
jgi:uncharacterized repeat protein (TIGR01451 family)